MKDELLAGRYQLEQELGRGGMATVFLAMDRRLARRVAVKVMHPGEDGHRAERFRREAALAASLKHPNVLEVHDFGEDAVRGPFLVCEWIQGESLRELARRLAPVPPEVAAVLGWELARALEAAHARGVVHRDVKPENVLVAKGGPLKLADFGLAALADQERLTSTGAVTGSLAYMAPERLDTGAWSPASDVYAVGVILFELCTGTTPHAGKGSAHLAVSVMTRDAPLLSELLPGTPEPFAALVDRCLARDARDRPTDGAELAASLEATVARLVGPPAEASRRFFQEPEAAAAHWREARFQRLMGQGRALLSQGEGARAARLLNEALTLRPASPEVLALLRSRPRAGRAKVFGTGAVLVGLLGVWGAWKVPSSSAKAPVDAQVPAVPPRDVTGTGLPVRPDGLASTSSPPTGAATLPVAGDAERSDASPSGSVRAPHGEAWASVSTRLPRGGMAPGSEVAESYDAQPSGSARPPRGRTAPGAGVTEPSAPQPSGAARPPRGRTAPGTGVTEPSAPQPSGAARPPGGATVPETGAAELPAAPSASPRPQPASSPLAAAPSGTQGHATPGSPQSESPLGHATLTVMTRPWAEVFVDGQSRGYTPRVREVRLSPGTHRLRFDNPLCDVVEEVIDVAAGDTVSREVILQVRKAEVSIVAPAGARLFLDGTEVGTAPLRGPVRVPHGEHVLSARGPGGAVLRQDFEAVAGERTEVVLGSRP